MPIISPTAISPHRIGGKSWSSYWTKQFAEAAGITDATELAALKTLIGELLAINNTLPNFVNFDTPASSILRVFYPFLGSTADACKYNLIDPRDHDTAFRIAWTGAASMTFNQYGAKGIGTNATYGDTKFNPLTHLPNADSNGLDVFVNSYFYTATTRIEIGVKATTFFTFGSQFNLGSMFCKAYSIGTTTPAQFKQNRPVGFMQMNLLSNAAGGLTLKRNNETSLVNAEEVTGNLPNANITLFKMNGVAYYSDNYISCAGIRTSGLSDDVNTLYYNAIRNFMIALGRYPRRLLYTDGHSMMSGEAGYYTYLEILQKGGNTMDTRYVDFWDRSVGGECFDDFEGRLSGFYARSLNFPVTKKIIVVFGGINDICVDNLSGAQTWTRALSYITTALGYGLTPVLLTVLPTTLYSKATEINDYNALLKANIPTGAYYVDLSLIPETADPDNTTYYSDKMHPTATLTHLITDAVGAFIKTI